MSFQTLLESTTVEELANEASSSDSLYETPSEEESSDDDDAASDAGDAKAPRKRRRAEDTFAEDEDDSDLERQIWGKRRRHIRGLRRRRRHRNLVPPEFSELMGEANAAYMSGDHERAITMLKDFIKKAPTVPDPYHTLGMIYEKQDEPTKAIQFYLIACTLTSSDAALWRRVGEMAKENGNPDQATYCYKMACQADPKDIATLYLYAETCKEQGDNRRAAETLKKIALLVPDDLSIWLQVAECFHSNGQKLEAIDALTTCIRRASNNEEAVQYELHAVNMLSDLYITLMQYSDAVTLIEDMFDRKKVSDDDELQVTLPLDIVVKYGICQLNLGDLELGETMFQILFAHDLATFGDLHVDVAEAYAIIGNHDPTVISILEKLLDVPALCSDKVYVLLGQAYERQSKGIEALSFFEKALQVQAQTAIDPHVAYSALSLCLALGKPAHGLKLFQEFVATAVLCPPIRPHWVNTRSTLKAPQPSDEGLELDEDPEEEAEEDDDEDDDEDEDEDDDSLSGWSDPAFSVDAMENQIRLKLLLLYGRLHRANGDSDMLCKVGIPVIMLSLQQSKRLIGSRRLMRKMQRYYDDKSNKAAVDNVQLGDIQANVWLTLRATYVVNPEDPVARDTLIGIVMRVAQQILVLRVLSKMEHYELIMDVGTALTEIGQHACAIELLTEVNCSDKVSDPTLRYNLRFLALTTALAFKENRMAYECARLNILEDPEDVGFWNLFCHVISFTGVFSWHQKFLAKVLRDHPKCVPAMIMAGHRSSAYDISALAVGELTLAHLELPEDPLVLLCIGLAYLNSSMQRTVQDRQQSVVKSFAFLQSYQAKRIAQHEKLGAAGFGADLAKVEGWYNTARGYHQLDLNHLAIAMYERVLRYYDKNQAPTEYRLCRDAAYNLSLIYKKSGAVDLAHHLLHKYLVVD
ncbi:transcription factor [Achlya hypogyna]|uniref:Transcription factor n=1 Tax=Achlya hypogyna TaxID=1202772 RepID=A0A1V9YXW6_ACHHY|nr:transcription factor [Achlya hypogyna]